MDRTCLATGSLVLLIAVMFGAFGAHALKERLDPSAIAQWKTAVEYQFYHGLGLLILAGLATRFPGRAVKVARNCFVAGIILFCGSIYLLSTREMLGTQGLGALLGPITPVGGLFFMVGWAVLFITAWRTTDVR